LGNKKFSKEKKKTGRGKKDVGDLSMEIPDLGIPHNRWKDKLRKNKSLFCRKYGKGNAR